MGVEGVGGGTTAGRLDWLEGGIGVEVLMGLPDGDSARAWGGRLLMDRDGAEIGICREIFLDDATGKPEWATADVADGPAFVPLIDAVESGTQVRVAVRGVDVARAPSVGDVRHLSEEEEERLYRHYGIEYSRATSDSGLPADAGWSSAPTAVPPASPPPSAAPDPTTTTPAEGPADGQAWGQSAADVTETGETASARPLQARRMLLLGLGLVAALGAIVGAVLRSRRRTPPPPTRAGLLAARARSASLGLDLRRRQAMASAAPLVQTGSRISVAAARRAAMQAAAAAERASALAVRARGTRLLRASSADEPVEATATVAARGSQRRARVVGAAQTAVSFGAGYLAGSRAGQSRVEQVKVATTTWSQRPEVLQARNRLRGGLTNTLQAGNARRTHRTATVAGKLRRRRGR